MPAPTVCAGTRIAGRSTDYSERLTGADSDARRCQTPRMFGTTGTVDTVYMLLEITGIIAFAVSGVMAAARCHMDWLGGIVLGVIAATGGGTLRDILIGEPAVNWIMNPRSILIATITAVVVIIILAVRPLPNVDDWFPVQLADACGLAIFVVVGAGISIENGVTGWLAVLLGVITGTFGGVTRDILTGRRPLLLVGEFYAVAAIAGAAVYVAMVSFGIFPGLAMWVPMAVVLFIRIMSIKRKWRLPLLHDPEGRDQAPEATPAEG